MGGARAGVEDDIRRNVPSCETYQIEWQILINDYYHINQHLSFFLWCTCMYYVYECVLISLSTCVSVLCQVYWITI